MKFISLQGYVFEVDHSQATIPEDAPVHPALPAPGSVIDIHKLQLIDPIVGPGGQMVGVREVYELDLSDRQRDELVRQLQGGAPTQAPPPVLLASAEALRHLPPQPQPTT